VTAARGNRIDSSVAHPARRYNYWLGGKDHFAADRASGDDLERQFPGMRTGVQANRDVLGRMVRHLAADAGLRQFLDIGTGLPTAEYTHQIAQRIDPSVRVVYVDNDPMVVAHSRALLAGDNTVAIEGDLRQPDKVLEHPEVRELIDLGRPVGLLLLAILHFVPDAEDPFGIVGRYRDALPAGSHLAISHGTRDIPERPDLSPEEMADMGAKVEQLYQLTTASLVTRTRAEVERFFDGLELLDPGVVEIQRWRPDGRTSLLPGGFYGGVARKR
jgi:S-adenosyl methyltransferase